MCEWVGPGLWGSKRLGDGGRVMGRWKRRETGRWREASHRIIGSAGRLAGGAVSAENVGAAPWSAGVTETKRGCQKKKEKRLVPPVAGADLRAALVASCLRGALPPVDLRAVCLVRAIL